jgi:peptide-methionine (S)-S-oxide reductase
VDTNIKKDTTKSQVAVFGGGCFWCTEAVFKMLRGVSVVKPGYVGGTVANPTYDQVCSGRTGHAEAIYIEYDPSQVKYTDLLTVFFGSHDPTTLNRQGNDVGTQYRSAVFYTTPEQEADVRKIIREINSSNSAGASIVTEVVPLSNEAPSKFYEAENYHKDYFSNHPENPYCQVIINPKLEKIQNKFAELLKTT